METRTVKVNDPNGLHLRVASEVVKACRRYRATVSVGCAGCPHADGCSILSLLLLSAPRGTELTLNADGPDARQALDEVVSVLDPSSVPLSGV